jgi:hypothetical protein
MLTGRTIRTSIAILAAAVAAATQAEAHSTSCTPAHLVNALKQVEAQCGAAKIVSAHRPGARIAGTRRVSQHSFCNGTNGAIDAVFSNRACALSALRKTNYTILTYGKSAHIHIGTDGWRNGANTHVARRNNTVNARVASRQRAGARYASRQRTSVRTARAQSRDGQNGWDNANWSNASWSNGSGAERAHARRSGARSASRQRTGVRVAHRQGQGQNWGDAQWSGSNWSSDH